MRPRCFVLVLLHSVMTLSAQAPEPRTVPEATGYTRTSTVAEVETFLAAVRKLPHADRLKFERFGPTHEGRELPLVTASLPGEAKDRLRALVMGNIHAGEVEG